MLGLILLLLFDGIIKGSDQAIFGNAVRFYGGNLQVHAPGYRDKASRLPMLPLDDPEAVVQAARALPDVQAVAQRINTAGIIINRGNSVPVAITAIQPDVEAPISLQAENVSQGRFLLPDDGDAIFIGKALADRLGVRRGRQRDAAGPQQERNDAAAQLHRRRHLRSGHARRREGHGLHSADRRADAVQLARSGHRSADLPEADRQRSGGDDGAANAAARLRNRFVADAEGRSERYAERPNSRTPVSSASS